jgi:hypothetical protein
LQWRQLALDKFLETQSRNMIPLQGCRLVLDKFLGAPSRSMIHLWGRRLVPDKFLEPPPRKPPPRKETYLSCLKWHWPVSVKISESPLRDRIVLRLVPEKIPEPLTGYELPLQRRRLDLDQFLQSLAGAKILLLREMRNSASGIIRFSELSTRDQYFSFVRCFR